MLRRSLTLAAALPLWIVMVLAGGQWCLMPGSAAAHSVVSGAMRVGQAAAPGLPEVPEAPGTPGTPARSGAHGTHAAHRPAPEDASSAAAHLSGHSPTSHHGEGERSCASQAACSMALAPAELQLAGTGAPGSWRVPATPRERPASLTLAPELPPPRA